MVTPPLGRKTHIIRIFGTNSSGEILDDMWADVERIDELGSVGSDDNYQVEKRRYRWMDNPDGDNYNPEGNPARETTLLKLCDPENTDDFENPDEWIPLKVVDRMQMLSSALNAQGSKRRFKNSSDRNEEGRTFQRRRVYHYDTNIDDDAEAAADAGKDVYVVEGADGHGAYPQYERDLDTKDEDQYVEYEVLTKFNASGNNQKQREKEQTLGAMGLQATKASLKNDYLINEITEDAKLEHVGPSGINPPYRMDPYQHIININWGGMAVEFEGNKDTLEGSVAVKTGDMRKGLLSVWFRVPQSSINAAVQKRVNNGLGIIPIVTFGGQQSYPDMIIVSIILGYLDTIEPAPVFGEELTIGETHYTLPSMIGVKCDTDGTARLFFNLQFPNKASVTNGAGIASGWIPLLDSEGKKIAVDDFTYSDGSDIYKNLLWSRLGGSGAEITPDHWHHVILSWDTAATTSSVGKSSEDQVVDTIWDFITGFNLVYCALDDVNLLGTDLPVNQVDIGPPNPNAAVPDVISTIAANSSHRTIGQASASFSAARTPLSPLAVPADLELRDFDTPATETVELGPLQIFSGIVRNTSSLELRRLFIDENGEPQSPKVAEEELGLKPDVLFHRRGSWKNGHNAGLGKEELTVTGKIERWDPEPSLFGPQEPTR